MKGKGRRDINRKIRHAHSPLNLVRVNDLLYKHDMYI